MSFIFRTVLWFFLGLAVVSPPTNVVATTASLSQARYYLAATSAGSLAIFGGGISSGVPSSVVDVYNAANNSWTTASLSQARNYLTATSTNESLAFFCGGQTTGTTSAIRSSVVDIYSAENNTWTSASLSQARDHLSATSVGSLALVGGGGVSVVVDIFDGIPPSPSASPTPSPTPSSSPQPQVSFAPLSASAEFQSDSAEVIITSSSSSTSNGMFASTMWDVWLPYLT